MVSLATGSLTIPKQKIDPWLGKILNGSCVATLSGQTPMTFGEGQSWTFDIGEAEYVAEGGNKGASTVTPTSTTVKPFKFHKTLRFNEEVLWAEEDRQIEVVDEILALIQPALSRALDFGVFHEINPTGGAVVAAMNGGLADTTNLVEYAALAEPAVGISLGTVSVAITTGVLTVSAPESLVVGDIVRLGTMTNAAPLIAGKDYYVKTAPSTTTLTLSETLGGAEISTTSAGSSTSIQRVTFIPAKPYASLDAADALVLADGFVPRDIALDPTYAARFSALRGTNSEQKLYPNFRLGIETSELDGHRASVSNTVRGSGVLAVDTKVLGFVGDFSAIRWGVQKQIGLELIKYGDPDGGGDLKRANQVAFRAEVVYGWGIANLNAFAKIHDLV